MVLAEDPKAGTFGYPRRARSLGAFHVNPLAGFGGLEDGVANVLGAEGVAEVGEGFLGAWVVEALHELDSSVDEGMLVTKAEAGDPPISGVGVVAVRDMDAGPPSGFAGDVVIEVGETVEVVEVPGERLVVAVDFEGFECFVSTGVAGGLEDGGGAVFETGEEGAGVVDRDRMNLSGFLVDALLDEGFGHGGDTDDVAVDPAGAVDVVCEEVAGDAGAGGRGIESPESGAPLGKVLGHGPVLKEVGAVVVDTAKVAPVDDLLCKGDGGKEAVVIPNEVGKAGGFDRFDHLETLLAVEGEGLFAKDHFAILDGSQGDVIVRVIGRTDVDGIDVVTFHQLAPVSFGIGVAPFFGEFFYLVPRPAADDLFDGDVFGFEKVLKLGVGIRMGATHEAVANDADADRFFAHLCDRLGKGGKWARMNLSILH